MAMLRKCPFCGGKAVMDSYKLGNQIRYYIHCGNKAHCSVAPCTLASPLKIEVADWWNGGKALDEEPKAY